MADSKKKCKKVNKLTLKECESILFKLDNQSQSKYYKNILERMTKLNQKK